MPVRPHRTRKMYRPKVHPDHRKRTIAPLPYSVLKQLHRLDFYAAQATLDGSECVARGDEDLSEKIKHCNCMKNGAIVALWRAGYTCEEIGVILKMAAVTVKKTLQKLRMRMEGTL